MEEKLHYRKSPRLTGFDYSQPGAYFITIKTNHENKIFGHLFEGKMHLNEFGEIIKNEWLKSMKIRREIVLDEFVILPNHFHAIVWIIKSDMDRSVIDLSVGANGLPIRSPATVSSRSPSEGGRWAIRPYGSHRTRIVPIQNQTHFKCDQNPFHH